MVETYEEDARFGLGGRGGRALAEEDEAEEEEEDGGSERFLRLGEIMMGWLVETRELRELFKTIP